MAAAIGPAAADCAISNGTATCTGDLSGGISLFDITTANIFDVTGPIAPPQGTAALSLVNLGSSANGNGTGGTAPDAAVTMDVAGVSVTATASPGLGVALLSGAGGDGAGTTTPGGGTGQSGGTGGAGGIATLTVSGDNLALASAGGQTPGGIIVESVAGDGGLGDTQPVSTNSTNDVTGGDSGAGGTGNTATATIDLPTITYAGNGPAVTVQSLAGTGNGGDQTISNASAFGGNGGAGGAGGAATLVLGGATAAAPAIAITNASGTGLSARSYGGAGGNGTSAASTNLSDEYGAQGGNAGNGGNGGSATIVGAVTVKATATGPYVAILAESVAGAGGNGGDAAAYGEQVGGNGGVGGGGGGASLGTTAAALTVAVTASGNDARGLLVRSVGAAGGNGGTDSFGSVVGTSGAALGSGPGGAVSANLVATISTSGDRADALVAQSVGGFSGTGNGYAASAASAGAGGTVTVVAALVAAKGANAAILTAGDNSNGVIAQSVGGGGGTAFDNNPNLDALGGTGFAGGDGGTVEVTLSGASGISTLGTFSRGVYADSVGGGGGNAGPNDAVTTLGASGGTGGSGGEITVDVAVPVATAGDKADAIFAASRGGGGGSATSTSGIGQIGGLPGGGGGDGSAVTLGFGGQVSTAGADADGVFAHSVGGGGGDGASVISRGTFFTQAIGGAGADGGSGGNVAVAQAVGASGTVTTTGDRSRGVVAQSVGGGGGQGGAATAASYGLINYTSAVGGTGGAGGGAGTASVSLLVPVLTSGRLADGIFAQSIGGGGGISGATQDSTIATGGIQIHHAIGGTGGGGGSASAASAATTATVTTRGQHAAGIVAQSVGGGGGNSGAVISGTANAVVGVSIAVGGSGGSGGDAGAATVSAGGLVSTAGDSSRGIYAHSIAGGGGHAGTIVSGDAVTLASVGVALGGTGGTAGTAGSVTVNAAAVTTAGADSAAITALSVGGGGGSGSAIVNGSSVAFGTVDVSIGSDGGAGGSAGKVAVTTTGGLSTAGKMSEGVYAGSIGGAGGVAGIGVGSAVNANVGTVAPVTVTLGGNGGKGGTADDVTVSTGGDIATVGVFSAGVLAQSLGGGGGRALGAISANIIDVASIAVTVGGSGGAGGKAGAVSVGTATGTTIATQGAYSYGIAAQSLGGAGGSGGFAAEISANINVSDTSVTGQIGVTVGGTGGAGGTASTVDVGNDAAITTGDFGAVGILAQSVGGHGGAGGNVYVGNLDVSSTASMNIDVDVGGSGGGGGTADTVTVDNKGAVSTNGFLAPALLAQSIGGNGGNGGSTYTVAAQAGPASAENVQVSVGGHGGQGGVAAEVEVRNSGILHTAKGGSDGLFAQSIGGNGGRGGSAAYLGINLTPPGASGGTSFSANINVGVGGTGGTGGDAGEVKVVNEAAITTSGQRSRGLVAQSVGGGGGDGGTASATSYGLSDICNVVSGKFNCPNPDDEEEGSSTVSINSTVQIGGAGGAAGDGKAVNVTNSAAITTAGQLGHGIYAQSIGGGGGNGGEGALGIEAWTTNQIAVNITDLPGNLLPSFSSLDVAVGGAGGAAGKGGTVTVNNTGAILINGPDASYVSAYTGLKGGPSNILPFLAGGIGIFAQSVGGGGGDGGAGSSSLTAIVTVGNSGSGGGDGGDVTVINGNTITNKAGYNGIGILAQSVGGGGGTAGDVGLGWSDSWEGLNIGVGVGVQGDGGAGGNGGKVSVTSSGAIVTTGVSSHGILAQSVGGSGGMAGISTQSSLSTNILVGSTGGSGDGGDVSVTVNAPISVSGSGSVGVAAHSASGVVADDSSGTITIGVNSDISAAGEGGRGLLVGSASFQNMATGAVSVAIASGAKVSTGATSAETVGILGAGAGSTLTNAGTIVSGNTASYAVRVEAPNPITITNTGTGTITGSILNAAAEFDAGGGSTLVNSGRLESGEVIALERAGSVFSNSGVLSAGGLDTIEATRITAPSVQILAGSTLEADLDFTSATGGDIAGDLISLGAAASAGGTPLDLTIEALSIRPNVALSGTTPLALTGQATVLSAEGALPPSAFTVASTGAVAYALEHGSTGDGDTIAVNYAVDTTPWSGPGAAAVPEDVRRKVNANHNAFGDYVEDLLTGAAPNAFAAELGSYVLNRPDAGSLLGTYENLIAEETFASTDATRFSALRFADRLKTCGRRGEDGMVTFDDEGSCGWGAIEGGYLERDGSNAGPAYDERLFGLSAGAQTKVGDGVFLGAALGWETSSLSFDGASGDVDRVQAGLVGKLERGATTFATSISGGWYGTSLDRTVVTPEGIVTAHGDPDGGFVAAHARIDYRFELGGLYLKPAADVGITYLSQGSYKESGAGGYGLSVGSLDLTTVSVNPFIEVGGVFAIDGMKANARVRGGVLALFGDDPSVNASFVGAPKGPSFAIVNDDDDLFADLGAAIDLAVSDRLVVKGSIDALLSGDEQSVGGALRLNLSF
jgi:hypothetical protein